MNRIGFIGGSDARRILEGDWYDLWMEKTVKPQRARRSMKRRRDIEVEIELNEISESVEQTSHLIRREQRWRAAADVDRRQGRTWWRRADLLKNQLQISLDGETAGTVLGIDAIAKRNHCEIAVKAAAMAEGNMEIRTSGRKCGHHPGPNDRR